MIITPEMFRSPDLVFEEKLHRYTRNGKTLVSVTQLLDRVIKPFDEVKASEASARRRTRETGVVITPEEVRAEWAKKRVEVWEPKKKAFGTSGTRLHRIAEAVVFDRYTPCGDDQGDKLHGLWQQIKAKGVRALAAELKMNHPVYLLAGTCDLLAEGSKGLWVGDWKQNDKFTHVGGWPNFLPPFEDLLDNKLTVFSIQVSMYRVMIEDHLGVETAGGFIGYVPAGERPAAFHMCHDLRGRVRSWLKTVDWDARQA
jgi:hypothetical protein